MRPEQSAGVGGDVLEEHRADREIGRCHDADAALFDDRPHRLTLRVPAGGADHGVQAERRVARQVLANRVGRS